MYYSKILVMVALGSSILSSTAVNSQESAARKVLQERVGQVNFDYRLTAHHTSSVSGISHWYFEQMHNGVPIYGALASVHLDESNNSVFLTDQLIRQDDIPGLLVDPSISAVDAAGRSMKSLGYHHTLNTNEFKKLGNYRFHIKSGSNFSADINARLFFFQDSLSEWHLAWELSVIPDAGSHYWQVFVDAHDKQLITIRDLAVNCSHRKKGSLRSEAHICNPNYSFPNTTRPKGSTAGVLQIPNGAPASFIGNYFFFPHPLESPLYGSRALKTANELVVSAASPYGWHNTTTTPGLVEFEYTQGNNAYAYYDPTGLLSNPMPVPIITGPGNTYLAGNVPNGGPTLDFLYNGDLNAQQPSTYLRDAITNAFVWANQMHDWLYLYGFTEAAGNFQENNYSNGGTGGDFVLIECQDGGDTNNANFLTPPEGQNPRMQLYIWEDGPLSTNPPRDACFDNQLIAHEYAHGLSMRLVQGPFITSCLTNPEQGGEGWSDFYGMLFTMGDQNGNNTIDEQVVGEGIRGLGNYLLDEAASNSGIRPAPYSTDFTINDYTYGDVPGMAVPHGVGFVWGTMLWEMTWELINLYGYEPNLLNTSSTAGNIRALKIVTESLKMIPCQPSFIDMRDAILAANMSIYGGQAQEDIWAAFARRGLGASASAGGNEAFDEPSLHVKKNVNKTEAVPGEAITYTVLVRNSSFASVSNTVATDLLSGLFDPSSITVSAPGYVQNGEVIFPIYNSLAPGDAKSFMITATVKGSAPTTDILYENGANSLIPPDFVSVGAIAVTDNPYEGSHSWFMAEAGLPTEISLLLNINLSAQANSHLSFWHLFDTESSFDGAVVEIQDGLNWMDLGDRMIRNGYNSTISSQNIIGMPTSSIDGRRAFSGDSNGYINTVIDLSDFSGAQTIRFRLVTDESNPGNGWFLDFFQIFDLVHIMNTACATANGGLSACGDVGSFGTLIKSGSPLPVDLLSFQGEVMPNGDIKLLWTTENEINNRGFEIYRRTNTNTENKNIGWEPAKTGQSGGNYLFLDQHTQAGKRYYYQLKQLDYDGKAAFSQVISLFTKGKEKQYFVYPNPTSIKHVYLSSSSPHSELVTIGLSNISGKLMCPPQVIEVDTTPTLLKFPELPAGVYLLRINDGRQSYVQQLVIQ